jgi:hypothetical protein
MRQPLHVLDRKWLFVEFVDQPEAALANLLLWGETAQPLSRWRTAFTDRDGRNHFRLKPQAFSFFVHANHHETEMLPNILRYDPFDCALPIQVDCAVLFLHSPRCAVEFPEPQKRIVIATQKCAPDILSKDAAVLVLDLEMLSEARSELIAPGMGAEAHYPVGAMREFPLFKKHVNSILRNPAFIERKLDDWQRICPFVQRLTQAQHASVFLR